MSDSEEPLFREEDVAKVLDRDASRQKHLKFVAEVTAAPVANGAPDEANSEAAVRSLFQRWSVPPTQGANPASDRKEYFVTVASLEQGPEAEARLARQQIELSPAELEKRKEIGERLYMDFMEEVVRMRDHLRKEGVTLDAEMTDLSDDERLNAMMRHFESCFEAGKRVWMAERARVAALQGVAAMSVKLGPEAFRELFRTKDPKLLRLMTEGWNRALMPNTSIEARILPSPHVEVPQESVIISESATEGHPTSDSTDDRLVRLTTASSSRATTRLGVDRVPVQESVVDKLASGEAEVPQRRAVWIGVAILLLALLLGGLVWWLWGSQGARPEGSASSRPATTRPTESAIAAPSPSVPVPTSSAPAPVPQPSATASAPSVAVTSSAPTTQPTHPTQITAPPVAPTIKPTTTPPPQPTSDLLFHPN